MWLSFSTLYHDLLIFTTCCNYFVCSLDPGKSIGNNYGITRPTKHILTQEKCIFPFGHKVTWMRAKSSSKILHFLTNFSRNFFQLSLNPSKFVQTAYSGYLKDQKYDEVLNGTKIIAIRPIDQKIFADTGGGNLPPPCRVFRLDTGG